jgi:uncharacterized membrane protein YidH (DUF202 family)
MNRPMSRAVNRAVKGQSGGPGPRRMHGEVVTGAGQRTDLAWVRSALAFGGVGAAMLKSFAPFGRARPVDGVAALVLGAAVLLLAGGYLLRRRSVGLPSRRSIMYVSAGTVAVGVLALVIGSTST